LLDRWTRVTPSYSTDILPDVFAFRTSGRLAVLFALGVASVGCHEQFGKPHRMNAFLGRCKPEVDDFAPSIDWKLPAGTTTRARARTVYDDDYGDALWSRRYGLVPLRELVFPNGVTEVRVWMTGCVLHGVMISHAGSRWSAAGLAGGDQLIALEPRQGWPAMWNELVAEGILALPDEREVSGPSTYIHATGYSVEINQGGSYRRYSWTAPEARHEREARSMARIAAILRDGLYAQWTL
jgi:hypothetical protein